MWSKDHGENWTVSKHARDNTTECAVVELSGGWLMLNMRDNRNRSDQSKSNGRAVRVTKDWGRLGQCILLIMEPCPNRSVWPV